MNGIHPYLLNIFVVVATLKYLLIFKFVSFQHWHMLIVFCHMGPEFLVLHMLSTCGL